MKAVLLVKAMRRDIKSFGMVWGHLQPITTREVKKAVREGRLQKPFGKSKNPVNRQWHIERIAYLVVHGWKEKITINCRNINDWNISDGNHRFVAAVVRGDKTIVTSLWSDGKSPRRDMIEFLQKYA